MLSPQEFYALEALKEMTAHHLGRSPSGWLDIATKRRIASEAAYLAQDMADAMAERELVGPQQKQIKL